MSINFSCQKCGHVLAAPEKLAGQRAKCRCGAVVVVPEIELQELPLEVPAAAMPPPSARTPQPTTPAEPMEDSESESAVREKLSELVETLKVLRPAILSAARIMAIAVVVATPLLVGGLYLLRMALAGIMELTGGAADPARFFLVFAILAAVFGVVFGFTSGHRLVNKSGLLGWPAWVVGMAGILALMVCGSVAARTLFPEGAPQTVSFCLFVVGLMSMLGISFFTLLAH